MVFAGIVTRGKRIVVGQVGWIGVVAGGRAVVMDFWWERKVAGFKHLFVPQLIDPR